MKKLVFVVDDQRPVLQTAMLILENIDPDWRVEGFTEPLEALEAVESAKPDLVLTDQVMPKIQGSELLEQVRLASPSTVRIIMSGQVALSRLSMITSAHQYIAKPFDARNLASLVLRTLAAQDRMRDSGLLEVVTSLKSLPSLPQVYHALVSELEDSGGASAVIARLVGEDPGLSSKMLQLANSPLFGQSYIITNPLDAVLCLGTEMIQAIVLAQTLFKHYASIKNPEVDVQRVWSHCWDVAQLAQRLCRLKRLPSPNGEQAFLAGLLHEVGRFILVENFPEQFQAACHAARAVSSPVSRQLAEAFRVSPAQIGAYLLELWAMPESVVKAVLCQEHPERETGRDFSITSALYIADQLACRKSPPDNFAVPEWNTAYLEAVGCAADMAEWEKLPLTSATAPG